MHEVSLVQALFDQTDRAIAPHPGHAVRRVTVRIGELAGVEFELFQTAFDGCRADRGYSAATLSVVHESAVWTCASCGATVPDKGPLTCLACGGTPRLSAGGDIILDRIELEVADV